MWKNSKQAKRQKTAEQAGGQLGGKAVVKAAVGLAAGLAAGVVVRVAVGVAARAAVAIGEEIIKDKEGEIQDKKALDTLFNKTIRYSIINNHISAITELYIWQLKGKALLLLQGVKLLAILKSVYYNKDQI